MLKSTEKKRQILNKILKSQLKTESFKCVFQNVYDTHKILWGNEELL